MVVVVVLVAGTIRTQLKKNWERGKTEKERNQTIEMMKHNDYKLLGGVKEGAARQVFGAIDARQTSQSDDTGTGRGFTR